jgi:hypothetical protein
VAVGCLTPDDEIGLTLEAPADTTPEEWVIVDNQNLNSLQWMHLLYLSVTRWLTRLCTVTRSTEAWRLSTDRVVAIIASGNLIVKRRRY